MRRLGQKLGSGLREVGSALWARDVFRLLRLANQALPETLFRAETMFLTRSETVPAFPFARNVRYRRLDRAEELALDALPVQNDREELRAKLRQYLAQGCEGFVAEIGQRIVAYVWVGYGSYHIREVDFDLGMGPDEACTFDSHVSPEYRLTRVYPGLARYVLEYLRARGVRAFLGWGQPENKHSMRTHYRMGYEVVGWVFLVRCAIGAVQVRRLASEGRVVRWRFLARGAAPGETRIRAVTGTAGPVAERDRAVSARKVAGSTRKWDSFYERGRKQ